MQQLFKVSKLEGNYEQQPEHASFRHFREFVQVVDRFNASELEHGLKVEIYFTRFELLAALFDIEAPPRKPKISADDKSPWV